MDVAGLVQKSVDDWNKKDKEAFVANFTRRSVIKGPGGLVLHGLEGAEALWDIWQGAFPDNQGVITDVFVSADQACAEVTFEGTHTGPLRIADGQIPATGRAMCIQVAHVHTICEDKFVTSYLYFDQLGLLVELGLLPIHGSAAANPLVRVGVAGAARR